MVKNLTLINMFPWQVIKGEAVARQNPEAVARQIPRFVFQPPTPLPQPTPNLPVRALCSSGSVSPPEVPTFPNPINPKPKRVRIPPLTHGAVFNILCNSTPKITPARPLKVNILKPYMFRKTFCYLLSNAEYMYIHS